MEPKIACHIFIFLFLLCGLGFSENPAVNPTEPAPEKPAVVETPSAPRESQVTVYPPNPWRVGFLISGLGAFSTVDYSDDYSGGLGWSLGLQTEVPLATGLRFLGTLGYQSLALGRYVGSTGGIVVDPSATLYFHKQSGPYCSGIVGVWTRQIQGHLNLGLEYFHAISAQQITELNTVNFTPGKFLFAVAGPSFLFSLREDWDLEASASFFVNLVGESQFKLMGGRLGLALRTPL